MIITKWEENYLVTDLGVQAVQPRSLISGQKHHLRLFCTLSKTVLFIKVKLAFTPVSINM